MERLSYVAVLAFCLVGTAWLEVVLRTRVYQRWRRLMLSVLPAVIVFVIWDLYAIAHGHWTFDPERTTGIFLGSLPLDELLFFIVIPICAVLSFEAVRAVKGWPCGDEATGSGMDAGTDSDMDAGTDCEMDAATASSSGDDAGPSGGSTASPDRARFGTSAPRHAVQLPVAVLAVAGAQGAAGVGLTYTTLGVIGVLAVVVLDLLVLRTRVLTRATFWTAYAIILGFQLLTNGVLTGFEIVRYNGQAIIGESSPEVGPPPFIGQGRLVFAPVEDLLFGFALVVLTLVAWIALGRRGIQREPTAGPPRWWPAPRPARTPDGPAGTASTRAGQPPLDAAH